MKMQKCANLFKELQQCFARSIFSLIYPPVCLHCDSSLTSGYLLFCQSCFLELELVPLEGDCSRCCSINGAISHINQHDCPCVLFSKLYAAFFLDGPILTLYNKLKTFQGSYLCQVASSFMAIQYLNAKIPLPHVIIPVPQSISDFFSTSYHFNYLLAENLAKIFNRPLLNALEYSYLSGQLSLKRKASIRNQTVLLVGDLLSSESKIGQCGSILAQGYPREVYGLTFGLAL